MKINHIKQKEHLEPEFIRRSLGASIFTRNMIYHHRLDSTNRLANDLASQGAQEGTLVLTEEQSAGRGRLGRSWFSSGYSNLLFSLLLRPQMQADRVFILTMILALAASDGAEEICKVKPLIKWPNDLYVGRKKLAGILSEVSTKVKAVEYVVLGIGLNVNWKPGNQEGLLYPATSLFNETGRMISRNELLIAILKKFEGYYGDIISGEIAPYYERWNELSAIIGRTIEIDAAKEKIRGKAVRINQDGALVVEDQKGQEQTILSGDVSVKF
ncbi:biotin--[acetyl-CoA-carboxylase] ligase [Thermodesulfobacteriota bacterium]